MTVSLAGSQAAAKLERCDRCGAAIHDVAVMPSGSTLQFCKHHKNELEDALNHAGAVWQFGNQEDKG